jgi:uncharacterized cupredoxin-like copper-binding protein
MSHRRLPVVITFLALAVAGCGGQSSAATPSAAHTSAAAAAKSVSMTEFKFRPKTLSAKPGKVRLTAKNNGHVSHELIVIRTNKAPNKLRTHGSRASEAGSIGEIAEQKPGKSASHTFRLKRGRYVFICNVPGHYKAGMYGTIKVR